ncbi:MAG: N-acetylmuramoyl-L-alanine amidase [Schwartzia sp.]|nr:N-acetylmuramoyl-L-alanine amidase [Schwartzia sp. (in: firmicutes)]
MRRTNWPRLFGLAVLCLWAETALVLAAPARKVTSFQSQVVNENGQSFLRIEIGMNGPIKDYQVKGDGILHPNRLTIDVDRAEKGDVRAEIPLDRQFAKTLRFQDAGKKLRIMVGMQVPANEQNYRVYTLEKDRRNPHRLIIELYGEGGRRGRVAGLKGRTIVIDPGHGGTDTGAVGVGGLREKDITLEVSRKVKAILAHSGVKVVMTREDDRDVYGPTATDAQELQARVDYGSFTPNVDVFVSIHCNAFTSASSNGTATYYYPKTWLDALLAQNLQDAMVEHGDRRDRGIHEARFYVCRNSMMPAALVELAFITNYVEGYLLADEDFQNEMAQGIAEGLANYFAASGT